MLIKCKSDMELIKEKNKIIGVFLSATKSPIHQAGFITLLFKLDLKNDNIIRKVKRINYDDTTYTIYTNLPFINNNDFKNEDFAYWDSSAFFMRFSDKFDYEKIKKLFKKKKIRILDKRLTKEYLGKDGVCFIHKRSKLC